VHDQQARDELVGGEPVEQFVVQPAGVVHDLQQPFQPGPVEVDDEPHQFLGPLARHPPAGGGCLQQGLDAFARGPEVGCLTRLRNRTRRRHAGPSLAGDRLGG
jgi:hypothetical protein